MLRRICATLSVLVSLSFVVMPTATADGDGPCQGQALNVFITTCKDRDTGTVTISLEVASESKSGGTVRAVEPVCRSGSAVIPCFAEGFGAWNGTCYVQELDLSQFDKETRKTLKDQMWDSARAKGLLAAGEKPGKGEGMFVDCTPPTCLDGRDAATIDAYCYQSQDYWAPELPPAIDDIQDLVAQAVSDMHLTAITPGTTPHSGRQPSGENYVGTIGLPVWLWAEDPQPNEIGPTSATASAGSVTVTADGELDQIVWDLGTAEIEPITCDGPGTPYKNQPIDQEPDCGLADGYHRDGEYTITATSEWDISWEGGGMEGTATLELEDSVDILMAEVQVLRQ